MGKVGHRIEAPMNAHAVLHIVEGFVGCWRSPVISGPGNLLDIGPDAAVMGIFEGQMMGKSRAVHG
jgi:hypothetical protein